MNHTLSIILSALVMTCACVSKLSAQAEKAPAADSASQKGPSYAIIVLDASGSMWGEVQGEAKIVIARRVIRKLISKLPENIHLGLVAYGHRKKGDCADIQLLIDPGKVNAAQFIKVVDNITPKGMTPLTSAIEFAAENLAYKEQKASVILVSDGKETCNRDPCEAAKKLEKLGIDFTAHVVAFDLTEKDAKSIECIARETGGSFLKANDADTLADALEMAIEEVQSEIKQAPEIKLDPATLKGPAQVPAGSEFKVEWTGPANKGDYITITPKDWKGSHYKNHAYVRGGSPLKLTAIMKVGPAELRYMTAQGNKVLGRADIEVTAVQATLQVQKECIAGAYVSVEWTGPDNKGDFITVVPKELEDGKYKRYQYTRNGSPVKILTPVEPGLCEIRYYSGQDRHVLARTDIQVNKADVTVKAPDHCTVGNKISIEWTGPNNEGDFITVISKSEADGKYAKYAYTKKGSPLEVTVPILAGDCEVRYYTGQGRKLLARAPITVKPAKVILKSLSEVVAGSKVLVDWVGPNNDADYITIVPKNMDDGKYAKYTYTKKGSPLRVEAPIDAGDCEIRYMSQDKRQVLGRYPIKVVDAKVTLKAPDHCTVGNKVSVEWTGPNNDRDFITIISKSAADGKRAKYSYTKKGNPLEVDAPILAGDCEVRYCSGQDDKVLARTAITVQPAKIVFEALGEVVAGSEVAVDWVGPNNVRDYITIVPKNMADAKRAKFTYTSKGNPLKVEAPIDAGDCEIRYMSGSGELVLGRQSLKVVDAKITLKAPAETAVKSQVVVQWTGPVNPGDYITIVPKRAPEGERSRPAYTSNGSPLRVRVPDKAGECEIRFVAGQGGGTLQRIPINITGGSE